MAKNSKNGKPAPRQMAPQGALRKAPKQAAEKKIAAKATGSNGANGQTKWVGQRFKRKEYPRLIQGISHYTDDLRLPGLLHCVFVRSPHAYAKITSISTDAARSAPGVVAVYTSADLKGIGPVPCAGALPDLKVPRHPVLAEGYVRFVGEPVAAIVAEDFYKARDAAELIEVDYEPLPAVVDPEKALAATPTSFMSNSNPMLRLFSR